MSRMSKNPSNPNKYYRPYFHKVKDAEVIRFLIQGKNIYEDISKAMIRNIRKLIKEHEQLEQIKKADA